jgi:hypothetical protein
MMLCSFRLEKLDAFLAECKRDLDALLAESQLLRGRKKVTDNPDVAERFIGVFDLSFG